MIIELFFFDEWSLLFGLAVALLGFVWAPKTWTPGELVSAAAMNTNIRDHLNESLRVQSTTSTGSQNNLAIEGPFAVLRCNNASALTITGMLIDSGNLNGAKILIEPLAETVTLKHQHTGSSSDNRIIIPDEQDLILEAFDRVALIYDGTTSRWRAGTPARHMIEHRVNLLADPTFLIWPEGDSSDPAHWRKSGTGAAIARETTIKKLGAFSAKLTYGSAVAYLDQDVFPTGDYDQGLDEQPFSCGAFVYAAAADAYIGLEDGSGNEVNNWSSAHPGGSVWKWLKASFITDPAATKITFRAKKSGTGDLYIAFPTVVKGIVPPSGPCWPRVVRGAFAPTLAGNPLSAGTDLWRGSLQRPFIVDDVQIHTLTDVSGQAMILDINQWDGAAWQSMFQSASRPQVAVSASAGGDQPDATTYAYRCFKACFGTGISDAMLNIDCDQAASSGGKNPTLFIRFLAFMRPQELLLSYNSVN